ncbi:MAG: hypothetical protein AAGD32_13735 [Planctomycetota bacterium]
MSSGGAVGAFEHDGVEYERVRVTASLSLRPASEDDIVEPMDRAVAGKLFTINKRSPDLINVDLLLDTEGVNGNWDYMTRSAILADHGTAKWKPMDMDHGVEEAESYVTGKASANHNTIFGVMTGASLCNSEGELLTAEQVSDLPSEEDMYRPDAEKVAVKAHASLWRFMFPRTAEDLTKSIASGSMKVSMERWISDLDYLTWNGNDWDVTDKATAKQNGIHERWENHIETNGYPTIRRTHRFLYGGVASTTNPANALSRYLPTGLDFAAASRWPGANPGLLNAYTAIQAEHAELHRAFATLRDDAERDHLIARHRDLHEVAAQLEEKLNASKRK